MLYFEISQFSNFPALIFLLLLLQSSLLLVEKFRKPLVLRVAKLSLVVVLDVKTNPGADERERDEGF